MIQLNINEQKIGRLIKLSDHYNQAKAYLEWMNVDEVYTLMQLMYLGRDEEFWEKGDHTNDNIRHLLGKAEWAEEIALGVEKFKEMQTNGFPEDFDSWWGKRG